VISAWIEQLERILRLLREILEALNQWPCAISWQPSALAPVFYGVREYGPEQGAPAPCRVFFPSLDVGGFAPILKGCGRYPLILFAHGQCAEGEHYKKWFELPATLARAGYVVVVPHLPATASGGYPWDADGDLPVIADILDWMRSKWEHRSTLLPGRTGIAGHSRGALLAAHFADVRGGIAAYASLSGVWDEWPTLPPRPIDVLAMPKLLTWGPAEADQFAPFSEERWGALATPKHKAEFPLAHWDYLPVGRTTCAEGRGPCSLVPALVGDVVTMFFGRYLPPERVPNLTRRINPTLLPPPLALTTEQEFYAGAYLNAFSRRPIGICSVRLGWDAGDAGTLILL
jgi:hypothetical protein